MARSGTRRAAIYLALLIPILCDGVLLIRAQDAGGGGQLLEGINKYRREVAGVGALTTNAGAACLAKQVLAGAYEGGKKECSNATGLGTVPGQEANYPSFLDWLSACNIPLDRAKDGVILPDCVPSSSADAALQMAVQNYTQDAIDSYINETSYASAGAAASPPWFVLILATNASSGDYLQTGATNDATPAHPLLLRLFLPLLLPLLFYCASISHTPS